MKSNKKGFTLLEIIVVVIIIGVLASLALPKFFATVEFSRSSEALQNLGAIKQSVQRCLLMKGAATSCDTVNELDIDLEPGLFNYAISGIDVANQYMTLTATRTAAQGGNTSDTVTLTVNASGIAKAGTGAFENL